MGLSQDAIRFNLKMGLWISGVLFFLLLVFVVDTEEKYNRGAEVEQMTLKYQLGIVVNPPRRESWEKVAIRSHIAPENDAQDIIKDTISTEDLYSRYVFSKTLLYVIPFFMFYAIYILAGPAKVQTRKVKKKFLSDLEWKKKFGSST